MPDYPTIGGDNALQFLAKEQKNRQKLLINIVLNSRVPMRFWELDELIKGMGFTRRDIVDPPEHLKKAVLYHKPDDDTCFIFPYYYAENPEMEVHMAHRLGFITVARGRGILPEPE